MEPMSIGSPTSSASSSPNNMSIFLPPYLMGDPQASTSSRNNTLSPKGTSRVFSSGNTPNSRPEFSRQAPAPSGLFGSNYAQQYFEHTSNNSNNNNKYTGTPTHDAGPPTQGLFDTLRREMNQVQTPKRENIFLQKQQLTSSLSSTNYSLNQTYQQTSMQFNDSYAPNGPNAVNASTRALCSPLGAKMSPIPVPQPMVIYFWVTVFGFPPTAANEVLNHFNFCGNIVDKVFAPKNGNWMHIKYLTHSECDKALNYNQKVICKNIMVGVMRCTDKSIIERENENLTNNSADLLAINGIIDGCDGDDDICQKQMEYLRSPKVRPLAQQSYQNAINDINVISPTVALPHRSTSLLNKAIDFFFS